MGQRPSVGQGSSQHSCGHPLDQGSSHHPCWHTKQKGFSQHPCRLQASCYTVGPLTTFCILTMVGQTYCLLLPRRSKIRLFTFASMVPKMSTIILPILKHLIQLLLSPGHFLYLLLSSISSGSSCKKLCLCLFHWADRVNTGTIFFSVISECFSASENHVTLNFLIATFTDGWCTASSLVCLPCEERLLSESWAWVSTG